MSSHQDAPVASESFTLLTIGEHLGSKDSSIEVKATSAVLAAAAFHVEYACRAVNDAFMICRMQNTRPETCFEQGLKVSDCTNHVLAELTEKCDTSFANLWKCLEVNNQERMYCREEENVLNSCTAERLGWHKRLWIGKGPSGGFKPENEAPEVGKYGWAHHTRYYKKYYEKEKESQ